MSSVCKHATALRFQDNFGVTLDSLVELVIGCSRIIERRIMRDNEAGLCSTSNNQVTQVTIVALYIALASPQPQTFLEKLAKGDKQPSFLCMWVYTAWISWHIQTRNAQYARGVDDLNYRIKHSRGCLCLFAWLNSLVANRINTLVNAIAAAHIANLLNRIALTEVN